MKVDHSFVTESHTAARDQGYVRISGTRATSGPAVGLAAFVTEYVWRGIENPLAKKILAQLVEPKADELQPFRG